MSVHILPLSSNDLNDNMGPFKINTEWDEDTEVLSAGINNIYYEFQDMTRELVDRISFLTFKKDNCEYRYTFIPQNYRIVIIHVTIQDETESSHLMVSVGIQEYVVTFRQDIPNLNFTMILGKFVMIQHAPAELIMKDLEYSTELILDLDPAFEKRIVFLYKNDLAILALNNTDYKLYVDSAELCSGKFDNAFTDFISVKWRAEDNKIILSQPVANSPDIVNNADIVNIIFLPEIQGFDFIDVPIEVV